MKTTIYLIITLILTMHSVYAQFEQRDGELTASITEYTSGKLNSLVSIEDIYYPNKNFSCLNLLGDPIKIDKTNSGAGDEYVFHYPGLSIGFHNTNAEQKMTLSYLEISGGNNYIDFSDNKSLKTNQNISDITGEYFKTNSNQKESTLLIPFYNAEGSKIILKVKDQKIEIIKIWF